MSLVLPSTKFMQCQVVLRNALKLSPNSGINALWSISSIGCNIQYDQFCNAKQVLYAIQNDNEDRIRHDLNSQGFILTSTLLHASSKTHGLWSKVQKNMPRNIFNFTIKYLNNTLATRENLCKWSLSSTAACPFCFQSETLQLYQVANFTWMMVDIPGVITQYFCIWPILYLHLRMPHYLLISLLSHPLLWLLEILSGLILSLYSIILLFKCWN